MHLAVDKQNFKILTFILGFSRTDLKLKKDGRAGFLSLTAGLQKNNPNILISVKIK